MDEDQKCLMDWLNATLDTNHQVRSFAEESLKQAALQPGFGAALAKIVFNKEIPFAAVLLKQFIKQHWQEDEDNFIPPIVSPQEKGVIREMLMASLEDSNGKIRTAVGMAISVIGQFDWPENWPELLPFLLRLINGETNQNRVRGALRCLALLCADLDDSTVPRLLPELFPSLHKIISSPHVYEKSLRAKALSIIHSCISVLGSMSGVYQKETIEMVKSIHTPLIVQFAFILQSEVELEDSDDWSLKMEVLKCLLQIVQNFPSLLDEATFSTVLGALWQTFVSSYKVYYSSCILSREDSLADKYDSDGEEMSLEALVIQLFELLTSIVCNIKLAKAIRANLKDLIYYIVAFQQITQEQEETWSRDANQYIADEDDMTYSCRVSGALLLEEIINTYGEDTVVDAAEARFKESCQAKIAGRPDWWKLQEASLFALCSVSVVILEAHESKSDLRALIEQMVTQNTGTGVEFPFLIARSFATVSKFKSVISKRVREQFILDAAQALSMNVSPIVKVGACIALTELLPESKQEVIQPYIMPLLSSLTDLLSNATEETLHLVLETLEQAVKAAGEQFIMVEPIISPIILNLWAQYVSEPFIGCDAIDVLEAIKDAPGCLQPLVCRILPTIVPILQNPKNQSEDLVGGSLDLLVMLLTNAKIEVVKAVFDQCFDPTVQILLQSEDHGEMQNATECLAAFVSVGRQEMLNWGIDQGYIMKRLLEAASRLLDPNLESSVSLFVGNYILQLILHLPSQMSPHLQQLVIAAVKRLESSNIESLKCSLILILARLVHFSAPNVDQFINLLKSIPSNGYEDSLSFVMSEWTKLQSEIQGAYQIKVTTSALALLLSTKNPELSKIQVQGHLIKKVGGIKTRSKSKSAPEQWTVVPLPVKIFSILADTIAEILEQVSSDEDDWEEVSTSDEGINEAMMLASILPSNSNNDMKHLDALAKIFDKEEDNESVDDDDDLTKADPLNEIKLSEYIVNLFKGILESDRPLFDYMLQTLTDSQKSAISRVLKAL
ncbi:hypothetical protein LUZ60_000160 [Juncus effusus]|nr:hypothetical protein LUZ60_000160 [Juncus effusus]